MSVTPDFLEPRPDLADHSPATHLDDTFNDMQDHEPELAAYAGLPLRACFEITDQFREFDRQALRYQKRHKLSTRIAASTGTLAVIMAILGLALKDELKGSYLGDLISSGEILFALVALAVALFGLGLALKEKWLLRRHQAELCRLLKFRFLLQPSRWHAGEGGMAWVEHALLQIRELRVKHSVREAIEAPLPRFTLSEADAVMSRANLSQLINYYRTKRLGLQRAYLENRTGQNQAKIRLYVILPPALFFLSVFGAAAHFGLEHLPATLKDPARWQKWILLAGLVAACLPVAATWARTIRAAFEHSRNRSRFRAASGALLDLDRCLVQDATVVLQKAPATVRPGIHVTVRGERVTETAHSSESYPVREQVSLQRELRVEGVEGSEQSTDDALVDARAPLQDMLWCEQILHTEHIEWLRLMVETEWYG